VKGKNSKQELNKYINKAKHQAFENQTYYMQDKTISYPNEQKKDKIRSLEYIQ